MLRIKLPHGKRKPDKGLVDLLSKLSDVANKPKFNCFDIGVLRADQKKKI